MKKKEEEEEEGIYFLVLFRKEIFRLTNAINCSIARLRELDDDHLRFDDKMKRKIDGEIQKDQELLKKLNRLFNR